MTVLASTLTAIKQYCAYQERCHSEVRDKLLALNCFHEELEEAIGILIEENFLNEERYAIAYAGGKFRMQNWGRIKIKLHLKQKQVSDYCIKKGLAQIDEDDYRKRLEQLLIKKKEALSAEKNIWKKKQKVMAYLSQKGFETELILQAWNSSESV